MGAKKFGMSLETREIKFFGGISLEFAGISGRCPKSLRKNNLYVFNFRPLLKGNNSRAKSFQNFSCFFTPFAEFFPQDFPLQNKGL